MTRIDKIEEEIIYLKKYILHITVYWPARFMTNYLSNLLNSLSEGLHIIKCKLGLDDKTCGTCGIKYKYCGCFLEYTNFKDNLIEYKCCVLTKIINTCLMKS